MTLYQIMEEYQNEISEEGITKAKTSLKGRLSKYNLDIVYKHIVDSYDSNGKPKTKPLSKQEKLKAQIEEIEMQLDYLSDDIECCDIDIKSHRKELQRDIADLTKFRNKQEKLTKNLEKAKKELEKVTSK